MIGLLTAATRFRTIRKPGYQRPVPFAAYAKRVIWGAIISANRRRHYRNATMLEITYHTDGCNGRDDHRVKQDILALVSPTPRFDEQLDRQLFLKRLAEILDLLPETQARILRRHFLDARTMRQIGEELGIGERTACTLQREALDAARAHFRRRNLVAVAA